jgi:transcriptional regulator with XRE-family HTH domain
MANLFIIRDLANKKGMTLRELSQRIGMSEDGLQKIIRKGVTTTVNLEKIANVLGVPVSCFFDDTLVNQQISVGGNAGGAIKMVGGDDYSKTALCPGALQEAQQEVAALKERLNQNEKLLEEKERTIQILLKSK